MDLKIFLEALFGKKSIKKQPNNLEHIVWLHQIIYC
jgi:hypothetical protein